MTTPSMEFLVGKATAQATTADTAYSTLNGTQASSFFRKVRNLTSGLTQRAQMVPVVGTHMDFNHVDSTPLMAMGLAETALMAGTADESAVVFSGRRLTPASCRMFIPIAQHRFLKTNIEGEQVVNTIIDLLAQDFANLSEEVCCTSVAGGTTGAGYGTGMLSTIDGFGELAGSGAAYDHGGGYYNTLMFRRLVQAIPLKWRNAYPRDQWKFFVQADAIIMLQDLFAQRATPLGDTLIQTEEGNLKMFGIELVPVYYIPTNVSGSLTMTGSSDEYTWVMLARPDNMYLGYRPEMQLFTHPNEEGNILNISMWAEWAAQFANVDEVAMAVNVTHNVNY